jgi:hypothetical protein
MSTFKINTFVKFAQVLHQIQWHIQLDINFGFIEPCSKRCHVVSIISTTSTNCYCYKCKICEGMFFNVNCNCSWFPWLFKGHSTSWFLHMIKWKIKFIMNISLSLHDLFKFKGNFLNIKFKEITREGKI